jgi:diguanylate cyclase (GGDEF)-like protein
MKRNKRKSLSPLLQPVKFYFSLLKKATDDYLFLWDVQNGIIMLSPNFVKDFAMPGEILTDADRLWLPKVHPDNRDQVQQEIGKILKADSPAERDAEYRVQESKGGYCWLRCRGSVSVDNDGKPLAYAGILRRMGQKNQADSVTGLLNKYQFEHAVKMALNNYHQTAKGGALLIFGLDNFKIVNETYNRYFGDRVLKHVAEQVQKILSPRFILYKLDGDVFGIVYPDASQQGIEEIFCSIQKCLNRPQEMDGKMYFCTVSAGTVFYPQSGKDYFVLYKHAEAAMDLAKRDGKNKNCIFSKEQYNRWVRSISMREDIQKSVERNCDGFSLFFQPIVQADGCQIMGAEALLRWRNPKGRMVAPMEFIPILEETKMILPVGRWIVERALDECQKWQKIIPDFHININVTYEQFKDPSFKDFVKECIDGRQMKPNTVILELTEGSIISDWGFLNQQFEFFHERGIGIAMDDFGTGYSSLASLKNTSCDVIKIDREFVKRILDNDFDRNLVKYTVQLCHGIGQKICVEGVEDQAVYDLLVHDCNVDAIQGYLFGHPESPADFEIKYLAPYMENQARQA